MSDTSMDDGEGAPFEEDSAALEENFDPPPMTPTVEGRPPPHDSSVRYLLGAAIVGVVLVAYMVLLLAVVFGCITVDEAKDLGAVELFSGLLALAGTVVGFYFGNGAKDG